MGCIAKIFSTTLDLYLTYRMVSFLDGDRYQRDNRKRIFAVAWMLVTAIFLYFGIDKQFYGVFYFGSLGTCLLVTQKGHKIRRLLYMVACALIVGMTNLMITCGLSFIFFEEIYLFDIPMLEMTAGVICFFLYNTAMTVGKRFLTGMENSLVRALLAFAIPMLCMNTFILLYAIHFTKRIEDIAEKRGISMVFSLVSLGMLIELFLVILSVSGVYSYRKMVAYKDELIRAQSAYNEFMKQSNYSLRKVKHDCKAHYGVISYLIEKERYQEAKDYVKELTDSLQCVGAYCDTGSFVVDALVSEKMILAKAHDVDFSFEGRLPEDWKMRETDQCILFSNILNNAFEAVLKVEKLGRKVSVVIRTFGQDLQIVTSNTYCGELLYEGGRFITNKDNPDEHGFGLRNITEIVTEYNGTVRTETGAGMFWVSVKV